jgi:DNA-binding CsgD family transcriptional regulator
VSVLTPQQTRILQLSAHGLRDKDIAERTGLAWHTVRRHIQGAYRRLGVSSRTAAVFKAVNLGLIEPVCPGCKELRAENRELRKQIRQQNHAIELLVADDLDEMKTAGANA